MSDFYSGLALVCTWLNPYRKMKSHTTSIPQVVSGLGIAALRNVSIRNETQMGTLYLKLRTRQLGYNDVDGPKLHSANGPYGANMQRAGRGGH